jgi:hypothetical protein
MDEQGSFAVGRSWAFANAGRLKTSARRINGTICVMIHLRENDVISMLLDPLLKGDMIEIR